MNTPKLVCFDMDDTLIKQNSWYVLNTALGITPEEDLAMYEAYGNGELRYSEWTSKLMTLYRERGLATKENVTAALTNFQFKEGATDLVTYLHNKGYCLAIITGSFDVLVEVVADALGIKVYKANTSLHFDAAGFLEHIESYGDEKYAKLRHLESICAEQGTAIADCVCIGDGANDIELFKATGKGITFADAPEVVKESAWKIVDELSAVKLLL